MSRLSICLLSLSIASASCGRSPAPLEAEVSAPPAASGTSAVLARDAEAPVAAPLHSDPGGADARADADRVEAARLSVYFHAAFGVPPASTKQQVMGLVEAATVLRGEDPLDRARAIARLYAMGDPGDSEMARLRLQALEALEQPVSRLDALFPEKGQGAVREDQVRERVDPLLHVAPSACGATRPISSRSPVGADNIIFVRTTLEVARPMAELRKVVDPQNWDCCGPDYFSQACVPKLDSHGRPIVIPFELPSCATIALPEVGSSWHGPLYERFRVGPLPPAFVFFDTIIDIDIDETPAAHTVRYTLNRSLGGELGPSTGSCDIDEGHVRVTPGTDGRMKVEATKRLRLKFPSARDTWFYTRLTASTLGIAGDSLEKSICCEPTRCSQP